MLLVYNAGSVITFKENSFRLHGVTVLLCCYYVNIMYLFVYE